MRILKYNDWRWASASVKRLLLSLERSVPEVPNHLSPAQASEPLTTDDKDGSEVRLSKESRWLRAAGFGLEVRLALPWHCGRTKARSGNRDMSNVHLLNPNRSEPLAVGKG